MSHQVAAGEAGVAVTGMCPTARDAGLGGVVGQRSPETAANGANPKSQTSRENVRKNKK